MQCGLTLPIMNPNIASMTGAVRAFRLLSGYDRHGAEFIESYGAEVKKPTAAEKL